MRHNTGNRSEKEAEILFPGSMPTTNLRNLVRYYSLKYALFRESPVILAVERPQLAVLERIERFLVRTLRIHWVKKNRDNHATFRNICTLSDGVHPYLVATYVLTDTDEVAIFLAEDSW